MQTLRPNDSRIDYSDYVQLYKDAEVARFDRILPNAASGFQHDNPGARIRFVTDAHSIFVQLKYTGEHTRLDALNGTGVYKVDGALRGAYSSNLRPGEAIFELTSNRDGKMHLYEVLLPFGDAVEFSGLQVNDDAGFSAAPPRPATRWVAYGDSITHGFQASDVSKNYPSLVGVAMGWQAINFGFGSHQATAADGKVIASLNPSVVTILIGVNDSLNNKPLPQFRSDYSGLLDNILDGTSEFPVYILTPLPVPDGGWNNIEAKLQHYRAVIREVVAQRKDKRIHLIEGEQLIPSEKRYFQDGLHPNDTGFYQLALQLTTFLKNQKD